MNLVKTFEVAFSLFLLMDPIGNVPIYCSLLKELSPKRQKWIIFRELLIALGVIIVFTFAGEYLLNFLHVDQNTVLLAGGLILFIIAIRMIFPSPKSSVDQVEGQEPFIVPLAIPLIAGPSVLAAVMIYSHKETQTSLLLVAIILAWLVSVLILLLSTALQKALGKRGIIALERLMGMILTLIAVQMFLEGLQSFLHIA